MAVAKHLVGRAEELEALDRVLAALDGGGSSAVEVVGEPGIGKTRLLAELAGRAEAYAHVVLSGCASELERDLPFGVFVDALDEYLQGLDPRRLDALGDDVRNGLANVFPSLSGFATERGAAFRHERHRSHRAVRELLERLTATSPLVLVLDDVHWADSASVDLLGSLLRRPPDADVLVVVAVRPRQAPDRLSPALEPARRAGTLVRVELDALTRDEAVELLGASVDETTAAALYDDSGGNPFYLQQLARALERASVLAAATPYDPPADLEVPPLVAAALVDELGLLPDDARLLARGAAVAGDPFDPELATAAADVDGSLSLDALDELLRLDVIRETDVPRRFRFRHPLVRRAVYESAPGGWRLGAHERCADALARRGVRAADRAHHVERAGRQGDATAVDTLREAGREAAHRAPVSAAQWFAVALRLLADDAPAAERVELLLARAGALATCGHFADAHAALLESIELVPEEAVALRVRLTTACAGVEHLLGRHDDAHGRLVSALEGLEDAHSPEAAALMIELALDGVYRMEFDRIGPWAGRALAVARSLDDRPLTASAAAILAWGAGLTGAVPEAEAFRADAARLVDALSDRELALRLDAAVNLAGAELYLDRFDEAGAHTERAIAVARGTGQPAVVVFAFMLLAWVRMLRGELADGGEMLDAAIEEARLLGNIHSLAGLLLNRSLMALAAGDVDIAVGTAEESVELTRDMDNGLVPAATGLALAAARLETGDARLVEAVELLLERTGGVGLPLMPGGSFRAKWLELLTRCWLALGRPDDAERAAACAAATAAEMGSLRMATSMADRAAAVVALASGDAATAARRALASAAAADDVPVPVEAALSRSLAGRALAQAGRRDQAVAELERAAAAFDACGARRYRDATDHELRRLGRRVYRRTQAGRPDTIGVEALTDREQQVARLVVDRLTNSQIAETLFLSPKTVETHLRNIFRKLDVASRVEVARTVEQADQAAASR
ncbi:MAG TPA: AAA family ATPase [Gaiellaceae bacterium]|nr:AAA family ATPase [Gaiellaceae bacterium]